MFLRVRPPPFEWQPRRQIDNVSSAALRVPGRKTARHLSLSRSGQLFHCVSHDRLFFFNKNNKNDFKTCSSVIHLILNFWAPSGSEPKLAEWVRRISGRNSRSSAPQLKYSGQMTPSWIDEWTFRLKIWNNLIGTMSRTWISIRPITGLMKTLSLFVTLVCSQRVNLVHDKGHSLSQRRR